MHSFHNPAKEDAKMLVTATPAGVGKFFEEGLYPAVEGGEPPLVSEALMAPMMAAAAKYGQTIVPPA